MALADGIIVAIYLAATLAIALRMRRRAARSVDSYFLGEKKMPWYLLCLSDASGMFDISGTMWLTTLLFVYGLKSIWLPWLWPVFNQIFLMAFLAIWLRRSGVRTGAEWILFRFGEGTGSRLSHLSVVLFAILCVVGFLVYAFVGIGKFVELFVAWPPIGAAIGIDVPAAWQPHVYATVVTALVTLYVVLGGMPGIVWTDVLQFAIMTLAALFIAGLAMATVTHDQIAAAVPAGWMSPGFGWTLGLSWQGRMPAVEQHMRTDGYALFGPFFMMMIFSGMLKSAAGPAPSYDMQRILAARSPREAAKLTGFVSVVLMPIRYLMIAGFTVLALVHVDRLDLLRGGAMDFERILPAAIQAFAPVGVRGLILTGLLAAFMATFAASLNAAPLYLVNDVYHRYLDPGASQRRLVRLSYAVSVAVVLVSVAIGLFVTTINDALQWIVSGLWGGYTAANVLKWYWWRFNGHGFFWGMIAGVGCALTFPLLFAPLFPGTGPLLSLYLFPLTLGLSGLVAVAASLATPATDMAVLRRFYRQVRPWGFWAPVRAAMAAAGEPVAANRDLARDAFNILTGTIVQTALVAAPVLLIVKQFAALGAALAIVAAGAFILWRTWYLRLQDWPDGAGSGACMIVTPSTPAHDRATTSPGDAACERRRLHGDWAFRRVGEDAWRPATVPGCTFSDLFAAGAIENPYVGDAEARLEWIGRADWDYRCRFTLDPAMLADGALTLVFDGLDTLCEVTLNGAPLLTAANMFRRWRCPADALLRAGENELLLRFRSPVVAGAARSAADGFCYPAENDKTVGRTSAYTRKAPYHFGWDWGPSYVTAGVWRPIWLERVPVARIAEVAHRIETLDDDRATVAFAIHVDAVVAGRATLAIDGADVSVAPLAIDLPAGRSVQHLSLAIERPQRWWPNGLGTPHLYRLSVTLAGEGGDALDRCDRAIGLRTVEVVNAPDADGESFFLRVNGRPVFMKGANYIPADSFLDRVDDARLVRLFRDCADANMNMLRVWGGGTYESDRFYDLADEHGILIWQDFMFSCSLYPADDAFLREARAEADDVIRRLRHHACLALWCGNNEISLGIAHWDWPEKFGYSPDRWAALQAGNEALFGGVLHDAVAQGDPDRFYMASSPIGFWNDVADDRRGDSHYWGVWHGELPFATFEARVPRFMSEYGFQSYPDAGSIARFVPSTDRYVGSPMLAVHQKHPRGDAIIGRFVREHYGMPADFDAFCYLSQLVQADGLRVAFEAHRRSMPFCMGSLYWQLNDCWPSISWSGIDWYGQWKALHHQAARSFAPLLVCVSRDAAGDWLIHLVSDRDVVSGDVLTTLVDWDGAVLWRDRAPARVAAGEAKVVRRLPAEALPAGLAARGVLVTQVIAADGAVLAEDRRLLMLPAQVALPEPGLTVRQVDADAVEVAASRYAHGVHLTATGDDGGVRNFADNFFSLLAGERRVIRTRDGAIRPVSLAVRSAVDATVVDARGRCAHAGERECAVEAAGGVPRPGQGDAAGRHHRSG